MYESKNGIFCSLTGTPLHRMLIGIGNLYLKKQDKKKSLEIEKKRNITRYNKSNLEYKILPNKDAA